jgi:hypothetical protein
MSQLGYNTPSQQNDTQSITNHVVKKMVKDGAQKSSKSSRMNTIFGPVKKNSGFGTFLRSGFAKKLGAGIKKTANHAGAQMQNVANQQIDQAAAQASAGGGAGAAPVMHGGGVAKHTRRYTLKKGELVLPPDTTKKLRKLLRTSK